MLTTLLFCNWFVHHSGSSKIGAGEKRCGCVLCASWCHFAIPAHVFDLYLRFPFHGNEESAVLPWTECRFP